MMTELMALWLPILVSSVFVFILSSIVNMIMPWHKGDYPKMEKQDAIMDAMRPFQIPPGQYFFPRPEKREEMKSAEFKEKQNRGPVMMLTVWPNGQFAMGPILARWFVYILVIGIFCAYVAGRALPPGASYLHVFRFIGATAFIAYSMALWQETIWYGKPVMSAVKSSWDGLLYALVTAGAFGWLWPH